MSIPLYLVDAFSGAPFRGNPAAVCLLGEAAPEAWMQQVAAEMNLSETAFVVPRLDGEFDLRWFTPAVEVELCGHATLASAHTLWATGRLKPEEDAVFHTASGALTCRRDEGLILMDFPANPPEASEPPEGLLQALGVQAEFVGRSRFDVLVELASADAVRSTAPDFARLAEVDTRGVIVTARSDEEGVDFVSRFFGPAVGIDEDPVTGSAHCCLAPYWAARIGRSVLVGHQASARGGTVAVAVAEGRVQLGGEAVTVLQGELLALPG